MKCKAINDIFEEDFGGFHLLKGRVYSVIEKDNKNKLVKVRGEITDTKLKLFIKKESSLSILKMFSF